MQALDPFELEDIRVEGAQRIEVGTIFNYLPVKVGDQITDETARESVRILFSTGFFNDVQLKRDGNTLIVVVSERPSIASIEYLGNKDIRDEEIEETLHSVGFVDGKVFSQPILDKLLKILRERYFSRGRYSATIDATVTPLDASRVRIRLQIDEGRVARIEKLRIVGNNKFSDRELFKLLELRQDSLLGFLSSKRNYSIEKLSASLEALTSFYLDRGYINFEIDSHDVAISQNKQDIFVTISITEGEPYAFGKVELDDTQQYITKEDFNAVRPHSGEPFSRHQVLLARSALESKLTNIGFAFCSVNAMPELDNERKLVDFTFVVDPGPKVYVRQVNVRGNQSTRDEVIRREMRQIEGAVYSAKDIRRSRERIQRLGYFDEVKIETPAVPGTLDQVDINVTVQERSTGSFMFGVGYAGADGVLLQAEINRENLFGSGRELKFKVNQSSIEQVYEVSYTNPYFTKEGISLGYFVEYENIDTAETTSADYESNSSLFGVRTKIPVTEFNSLDLSLGFEQLELEGTTTTPTEYSLFITDHPSSENLILSGGVTKDTRDSIFFPQKGYLRRALFAFTGPGSDLEYYKVTLRGRWYRPLGDNLTLNIRGVAGYGDGYGDLDKLPFFRNYYVGGTGTVRGYSPRSLGPRASDSLDDSLGGSKRINATTELYFPVPGLDDSKNQRLSFFIDAGQVYGSNQSIDLAQLRYSTGITFHWFTAVGPMSLSYAMPFNDESTDDIKKLQFTLGTMYR
ncbi:Outer membrane protein assembly factor YaeT precursor [hydrothermal vent metagenome]|uniref:Outer membrane protein assembly factor YaeT n=1 Tax=hydrothermal vent metagenome TaxID=652676 RepID=A0A160TXE5_9ZZZZ